MKMKGRRWLSLLALARIYDQLGDCQGAEVLHVNDFSHCLFSILKDFDEVDAFGIGG